MILLALIVVTLWFVWRVYHLFAYTTHSLEDKTVLVTGACSELGRRLCLELYQQHQANVIAWDLSRLRLEELRREALTTGPNAAPGAPAGKNFFVIMNVDVTSRIQVARSIREMQSHTVQTPATAAAAAAPVSGNTSKIDIILNAAHAVPATPLQDCEDDALDRLHQTHAGTPLQLARSLVPAMLQRKSGGQYVTVVHSCMAGVAGGVRAAAPDYAATQWEAVGLHGSLQAWARQLRRQQQAPGELACTLLYLRDVALGVPGAPGPAAAADPEAPDGGEGSAKAISESDRLDWVAADAVKAIARREERYGMGLLDYVLPLGLALPSPWCARLLRCGGFAAEERLGSASGKA
ncbi:short-chain dehydrogenase [Strigomonas culicis]|uniref:Short-chain dehydrogenase n=1 Tax=Strigomonas culicis TaxID=28005 RepID=S9V1Z0_9TRYP|nr:short-chain dehydrogenase [Strigomonas culicis]|eukprot:EPY20921.1 short-chain dehydrogenase [Strigomonas culicis]